MADALSTRTQVLSIIIRAQNSADAAMNEAATQAEVAGGRMKAAFRGIQLGLGVAGIAAAGALVAATKAASDYNTMLVHIQANTGLTDAQTQQMSAGIQAMAAKTGAPLEQLAEGFMHIHNFGFDAADAMKILTPAMESALSTGDSVATVASTLGVALHEFKLNADDASGAMNVLHLAAQEGNATLGEFVDGTTRAFNLAGGFGLKLQDVAAALSTLTQSGQTARAASDGLSAVMNSMVKPTSAATAMLNTLSHATGVDLVRDFSASGLKARGLTNVIVDVQTAINKMGGESAIQRKTMLDYANQLDNAGVIGDKFTAKMTAMARSINDPTQSLIALFPNVRAFREMMLLTGSQADSFAQHVKDMGGAMSGALDPTTAGFQREQATTSAQMAILTSNIQIMAIQIGSALLPILNKLIVTISPIIQGLTKWVTVHPQLSAGILATVAAVGLLAGGMAVLEAVVGPIAGVLGAIGVPLVAIGAAAFVLYQAWQHDWGGIQEKTQAVWTTIKPVFDAMGAAMTTLRAAFNSGGIDAVFGSLPGALGGVGNAVGGVAGQVAAQFSQAFGSINWPDVEATVLHGLNDVFNTLTSWLQQTGIPFFTNRLGDIKAAFQSIDWKGIGSAILNALGKLKDDIAAIDWKGVGSSILSALGRLKDDIAAIDWGNVWKTLKSAFSSVVSWIRSLDWGGWAQDAISGIQAALNTVGGWIQGAAHSQLVRQLGTWSGAFVAWIPGATQRFLAAWPGMLTRFLDWIANSAGPILTQLGLWAIAFVKWVAPAIPGILKALALIAAALIAFIVETGVTLTKELFKWGVHFTQWVSPAIPPLLRALGDLLGQLGNWISGTAAPEIGKKLGTWAHEFGSWVATKAWPALLTALGDLASEFGKWIVLTSPPVITAGMTIWAIKMHEWVLKDALPALLKDAKTLLADFTAWMRGGAGDAILTAAKTWPFRIVSGLGTVNKLLFDAGKAIVQGLISGMGSMAGTLASYMGSLAKNSVEAPFKKFLSIFSPSQSFFQHGQNVVQGLINGIASKSGALVNQMTVLSRQVALNGSGNGGIGIGVAGGHGTQNITFTVHVNGSQVATSGDPTGIGKYVGDALVQAFRRLEQSAQSSNSVSGNLSIGGAV